jgi:predicted GNAT family acetyltransferase
MTRDIVTSENREEFMAKKLGLKDEKLGKVYLKDEDNISHIFHNGQKVGQIQHQNKDNLIQILRSDVEKEHQGKGIGTEAYKQFIDRALKSGKSVGSDSMLTEHGVGIWKKLHNNYDVKTSENAKPAYPANMTTISREFREKNRPRTREYDSSYLSGQEPVYQIHPKKVKKG